MEHRHLGNSGLEVSALSYGNWITHGSQIEEDAAKMANDTPTPTLPRLRPLAGEG